MQQRQLLVRYNKPPMSGKITIENALFPFLFSFGHGAHDGKMFFNQYLKMRIFALFSIFTLYKPYMLLMFQV